MRRRFGYKVNNYHPRARAPLKGRDNFGWISNPIQRDYNRHPIRVSQVARAWRRHETVLNRNSAYWDAFVYVFRM